MKQPNKVLKVQVIQHGKTNPTDKVCYLTFHAWTNKQKAEVLETVVSNPDKQFRIRFTDDTPKPGEWFEEN